MLLSREFSGNEKGKERSETVWGNGVGVKSTDGLAEWASEEGKALRGLELGRYGPNAIRPICVPDNSPGFTSGPPREACGVLDHKKPSLGGPRVNPSVLRVFETLRQGLGMGQAPNKDPGNDTNTGGEISEHY